MSGHAALLDYFVGSIAALSLTLATLVFFWSGEIYCRAWARKPSPDVSLNRLGDMTSGVGAIGLGIALFLFGEPVLAATSGLLHALGKFGSAFEDGKPLPGWPANWPNPFRSAVPECRSGQPSAGAGLGRGGERRCPATGMVGRFLDARRSAADIACLLSALAKADLLLLLQEVRAGSAPASSAGNRDRT
ncbi:hypothetical protein [Mesorhizobium sp. M0088]|uniref:hypothetical protein n=1 Tax=Mesorhizobium sp. M0088 TaxID=2956873 RepID=UPI003336292C